MFFRRKKSKKQKIGLGKIDGLSVVKKNKHREGFNVYEMDPFIDLDQKKSFFYNFLEFIGEDLPGSVIRFFKEPIFDKKHFFPGSKRKKFSTNFQFLLAALLFFLAASLSNLSVKASFGEYSNPPGILNDPIATVDSGKATISWKTSRESTTYVYYGLSSENLNQSKESSVLTKDHEAVIDGLMPATVYYYKVQSYDMNRTYDISESLSDFFTFKTDDSSIIHNVTTENISSDSLFINWETIIETNAEIQYGETTDYGSSLFISEYKDSHTQKITGLKSGVIYHFRIIASNSNSEKFLSADYEFYTKALPMILDVNIESNRDDPSDSFLVRWKTNVPTDSYVSYEFENRVKAELDDDLAEEHLIELYDLQSNAEYEITISGKDQFGNIATSQIYRKKTEVNAEAPKISEISVQNNSYGVGKEAVAQILVTWKTDKLSTSQVQYSKIISESFDDEAGNNNEFANTHLVLISDLQLSQVYKIRLLSRDENDNITYSEERIVVTEDYQPSLLEVLASTINGILGD